MKKFPFLVCPNAIPPADFSGFIRAVSRTAIRDISVRAAWTNLEEAEKKSLHIRAVCLTGNFGESELQQKLFATMENAQKFHIPVVNIACRPTMSSADQERAIAFFRDAAACAGEKSLTFTLETYGVVSRTADECLRVLERVGHETLQICYDTANVWRFAPEMKTAGDLTRDFRKLAGVIGFMHLKDFDPETQRIMALGRGKIDFPAIFALLEEWKYAGYIGLDLETARARECGTVEAHEEELHLSLDYLSSLGLLRL